MKYTTEQLQQMCRDYFQFKAEGRAGVTEFLMRMFFGHGVDPERMERGMRHMIEYGTWE